MPIKITKRELSLRLELSKERERQILKDIRRERLKQKELQRKLETLQ